MTMLPISSESWFDSSWEGLLQEIQRFGFEVILQNPPDMSPGVIVPVNLIAAHPRLKLLLHARSRVECVGGEYLSTISFANVYGVARIRDRVVTTSRPPMRVAESWPTAVVACRGFRLSVRAGLEDISQLLKEHEFVNWFERPMIDVLSYADMSPFGGVSANDRHTRVVLQTFLDQNTLPSWFVDFAFPYRDLHEWQHQ